MKQLHSLTQNKIFIYIFCLFVISTTFISFIYKINLSNLLGPTDLNLFLQEFDIHTKTGGTVSDLQTHWQYIQILKEDFYNLFSYKMGNDVKLINFPLHHIIVSQTFFLNDKIENYLFFYLCFSLFLPLLFYLNLCEIFDNIDKKILILISSLIYILPAFQYSAIWGNSHLTALFFFLIGILFHLKLRKYNYNKTTYILGTITFLSLAAYTKQFYVFFFFFIFLEFLIKLKFKLFLLISFFTIILSTPGLLFLLDNPILFSGIKQKTTNFTSAVLITSSICFFYIIPFLVQYIVNDFKNFKEIFKTIINIKIIILSSIIFIICLPFFYYEGNIGGGIAYKILIIILNQKIIFFIFSFFGIYFLLFFTEKNIYSYSLTILILCTFTTGFFIFQKYFEPMFLIIFLLYFDYKKIKTSITNSNFILLSYFCGYYFITNYIYFFGV